MHARPGAMIDVSPQDCNRMFRRFFDEGLAQSSYLLACDRTRLAVVIDPRRDIDDLRGDGRAAGPDDHPRHRDPRARRLRVRRARAGRASARRSSPVRARVARSRTRKRRKARRSESATSISRSLHTPGTHAGAHHHPRAQPGAAGASVHRRHAVRGRGRQPRSARRGQTRRLAGDLFDSLQQLMALDDASRCGRGTARARCVAPASARDPSPTIGHERRFNRLRSIATATRSSPRCSRICRRRRRISRG